MILVIATTIKQAGGISTLFWGPSFFTKVYPDYEDVFSVLNAFVTICGGLPSTYIGGYLGDYYESSKGGKRYAMKGYISGFGILTASLFVGLCYIV